MQVLPVVRSSPSARGVAISGLAGTKLSVVVTEGNAMHVSCQNGRGATTRH